MTTAKIGLAILLVGAALVVLAESASAATVVTFTDSWKDIEGSGASYGTTGNFSTTISVPFDSSITAGDIDSNSVLTLSIGPSGAVPVIVSDTFGNAVSYSASGKTVTFDVFDASSLNVFGTVDVSWTATGISVSGSVPYDVLDQDLLLHAATAHTGGASNISTSANGKYFEVVLTVDASDNGGGIFTYDNPYVAITGTNTETEPAAGSGGVPLEQGSITGNLVTADAITLVVSPSGAGTITGLRNGEVLKSGAANRVTATPSSKQWIFSNWTDIYGDVVATNATFTYTNTFGTTGSFNGTELVANFVANPFYNSDFIGTYTGLFYDNNALNPSNAGYVTITVTATGAYSGRLYLSTSPAAHAISGQFSVADGIGSGLSTVTLSKSNTLTVALKLSTDTNLNDSGAGTLTGTVVADYAANSSTSAIEAQLSAGNTNIVPGIYNLVLAPASTNPADGPGGYSYGTATVSRKGTVIYTLHLADGLTTASFSSTIYRNGESPIYASLYGGKGLLFGWVDFSTSTAGTIVPGQLTWTKQPVKDAYYTNGFTAYPSLTGALYTAPKTGTNLFGATNLTFAVDANYLGASLPDAVEFPVAYSPLRNIFTSTNSLHITMTLANGTVSGTFVDTNLSRAPIAFRGVEVGGAVYGTYTDATLKENGPISIGPVAQ